MSPGGYFFIIFCVAFMMALMIYIINENIK